MTDPHEVEIEISGNRIAIDADHDRGLTATITLDWVIALGLLAEIAPHITGADVLARHFSADLLREALRLKERNND